MYFLFDLFTATAPETRPCPYMGKFEINNLIRTERSISHSNKHSNQADIRYFDKTYYLNKFTRSIYGDANHLRRIKRVDQDPDCDSTGFSSLVVGCNNVDTMEFRTECSAPDMITCKWKNWPRVHIPA